MWPLKENIFAFNKYLNRHIDYFFPLFWEKKEEMWYIREI